MLASRSKRTISIDNVKALALRDKTNDEMSIDLLNDFLYFEDMANVIRQNIANTSFDVKGPGKDIVETKLQQLSYENFIKGMANNKGYTLATIVNNEQAPYENLIRNTVLDVFYQKSFTFVQSIYKDLVLLQKNDFITSIVDNLIVPSEYVTKKATPEEATLIYGSIINYIIQQNNPIKNSLFYGDNTLAKRIQKIQTDPTNVLYNNYIVQSIQAEESGKTDVPSLIGFKDKNINSLEANFITKSFGEIKEMNKELYDDMILASLYQSGVVQSPLSYYSLIPYNDILPIINKALSQQSEIIGNPKQVNNAITEVLSNIGDKLDNIQKVFLKSSDISGDLNGTVTIVSEKSREKEFIRLSVTMPDGTSKVGLYEKDTEDLIRQSFPDMKDYLLKIFFTAEKMYKQAYKILENIVPLYRKVTGNEEFNISKGETETYRDAVKRYKNNMDFRPFYVDWMGGKFEAYGDNYEELRLDMYALIADGELDVRETELKRFEQAYENRADKKAIKFKKLTHDGDDEEGSESSEEDEFQTPDDSDIEKTAASSARKISNIRLDDFDVDDDELDESSELLMRSGTKGKVYETKYPVKGTTVDSENGSNSKKDVKDMTSGAEKTQKTTEQKVDNLKNQKYSPNTSQDKSIKKSLGMYNALDLDYDNGLTEDQKERIQDLAKGDDPKDHANVSDSDAGQRLIDSAKERKLEREKNYTSKPDATTVKKEEEYEITTAVNEEIKSMGRFLNYETKIINENKESNLINENEILIKNLRK
jgi:hypothetical protein